VANLRFADEITGKNVILCFVLSLTQEKHRPAAAGNSIQMKETERKFLVHRTLWDKLEKPDPVHIVQAYLSDAANCTVRVRTKGSKGYITVKGPTTGITRSEYEYEIPAAEALEMVREFCPKALSKNRYEIHHAGHTWEVDEFHGNLVPLIVAEIELSSEDELFETPEWIAAEVSDDPEYYNSRLILKL